VKSGHDDMLGEDGVDMKDSKMLMPFEDSRIAGDEQSVSGLTASDISPTKGKENKMGKAYEFFLGGDDAEMREIKVIVESAGCIVHDNNLSWGAKVSDYERHLSKLTYREPAVCGDPGLDTVAKAAVNHRYVTVELDNDIGLPNNVRSIDHHGDRSGEPPAIIQVCNLLGITPSRKQCLIGAMDAGYVYGLESIGAEIAEIADFLNATSWCGTIGEMLTEIDDSSEEITQEAERSIRDSELIGDCIVARCNHNKTAPITARMFGRQEHQNILILSKWMEDGEEKTEANYYGNGETIRAINKVLPGWSGGAGLMPLTDEARTFWTQFGGSAPDTAFWGCSGHHHGEVLRAVLSAS
jgi:hypothetical protein